MPFTSSVDPGTVLIKTGERRLYYVVGDGTACAIRSASVARTSNGSAKLRIDGKYVRPAWAAPEEIRRDNPKLPDVIPGGAPNNPMGERALTLEGGEYAIHGTNRPATVGSFVSYGCIRMLNEDIIDLYEQVDVGTRVMVTR